MICHLCWKVQKCLMPKSKGAAVCRGLKTRRIWNQNLLRSSLLKHVSHLWLKPDVFSCYKSTTLLPLLRKKNLLNNTSFVFNFPTPHFFPFISYLITTRTHIVYFAARHMSSRADWDILGFGQHFGCCHESSQGHLLLNSSTPNFLLSPCSPHITSCFPQTHQHVRISPVYLTSLLLWLSLPATAHSAVDRCTSLFSGSQWHRGRSV